jgi:DNA processing protein
MKIARLTDEQKLDWLHLIRCENIGPRTFRSLIARYGEAAAALAALPGLIRQGKGRAVVMAPRDAALREWEQTLKLGARFIALCEPDYPAALRAIDAPPPLIALRGDAGLFERPAVALVGSRNASAAGLAMTERLARGLGGAGYAIVSGLARGIDAAAHRASLASGAVGVMAGGLDTPYPPENAALIEQMAERGAVISEMPLGYEPRGRDFPRRNRIVAGLSLATVVVEAARRSGSLITARLAQEQGREVFAVPGSPLDPRAEGTNDLIRDDLIRDGALLCAEARDVIDVVAPLAARGASRYDLLFEPEPAPFEDTLWDEAAPGDEGAPDPAPETAPQPGIAEPREKVEHLLGPSPVAIDDLARACGCSVWEIRLAIQELEIEGRIERHGGDRVALIG